MERPANSPASADFTLNSAYMAGLTVRGRQWFAEARGTWMDLSASFSAPRLQVDSKATLFNARGGIRLADGLFATGGVRRVGLTLDTQLSLPALGVSVQGTTKPALWDPLIGIDWRRPMGRWIVDGNFQGGGFGVGTDVDLSGEANASWRGIPHTEIRLGFSVVYYKLTVSDVSIGSFHAARSSVLRRCTVRSLVSASISDGNPIRLLLGLGKQQHFHVAIRVEIRSRRVAQQRSRHLIVNLP